MTESEWLTSEDPKPMLAFVAKKVSERKLWLFATACCRCVIHLDPELGGRVVVESTEHLAEGAISRAEWEDAIGRIDSKLTELGDNAGMTSDRRAAFAIANLLYSEAAAAAFGASYHAWAALQLEAYPNTPTRQFDDGPMPTVVVASYPFNPYHPRFSERVPEPTLGCHPERANQAQMLRCICRNPFRPTTFAPEWRTETAVALARQMYESRDFSAMPILADALQDAGCDAEELLRHCRDAAQVHVRGCWAVDLVLVKE